MPPPGAAGAKQARDIGFENLEGSKVGVKRCLSATSALVRGVLHRDSDWPGAVISDAPELG